MESFTAATRDSPEPSRLASRRTAREHAEYRVCASPPRARSQKPFFACNREPCRDHQGSCAAARTDQAGPLREHQRRLPDLRLADIRKQRPTQLPVKLSSSRASQRLCSHLSLGIPGRYMEECLFRSLLSFCLQHQEANAVPARMVQSTWRLIVHRNSAEMSWIQLEMILQIEPDKYRAAV